MRWGHQIWILGLLWDQVVEPVQQTNWSEQSHQIGDVHVRDCTRLKLMDSGDGDSGRFGQVSLGKVHHQPVILEPQSEHL